MSIKTIILLFMFTVVQGYKYRKLLRNFLLADPNGGEKLQNFKDFVVDQIVSLKLEELKNNFVAIILDFDGVLSYYDDREPLAEVVTWLEQAVKIFGSNRIFILSNNPAKIRKEFFDKNFNNQIVFIKANQPKPYPSGIAEVFSILQLNPELHSTIDKSSILMVDDRLLSGILAAKIFGATGCLITRPYINIKKHFILENWFILLRKLERLIIWHL